MRVLWFTGTSAGYRHGNEKASAISGGWMVSLQEQISSHKDIELGVCFLTNGEQLHKRQDGVDYYMVPSHTKSTLDKFLDVILWFNHRRDEANWPHYITRFAKVIEDFKPDVIEIFGSEVYLQLAALSTGNVPTVLHIQGLLNFCYDRFLPPGLSKWRYYFLKGSLRYAYTHAQTLNYWKRSLHREKTIISAVNHFIGRTSWDHEAIKKLNSKAIYHYGGELLRREFYEPALRCAPEKITISTIINEAPYKGFDTLLRIADILRHRYDIDFDWNVYGNVNPAVGEYLTGLKHNNLGIHLRGCTPVNALREALLSSTLYVHPSYMENSPNSVGEAQILGLPVVATDVGGTSSMVNNGVTGLLFQAGDAEEGAAAVLRILKNPVLADELGKRAREEALARHDPQKTVNDLIATYKDVISYRK